jgi:P27 family predicted phage terminase small subunit
MDGRALQAHETVAEVVGMKGRKPTPTALRVLHGNPGKRRFNLAEPRPDPLPTECPAALTDPLARQEWAVRVVPAILRGQVTSADYAVAFAYCELFAEWRACIAEADRQPRMIKVGTQPQPNPYRSEARRIRVELWKIAAELGFTPTSRARVYAHIETPQNGQSKWAGLL